MTQLEATIFFLIYFVVTMIGVAYAASTWPNYLDPPPSKDTDSNTEPNTDSGIGAVIDEMAARDFLDRRLARAIARHYELKKATKAAESDVNTTLDTPAPLDPTEPDADAVDEAMIRPVLPPAAGAASGTDPTAARDVVDQCWARVIARHNELKEAVAAAESDLDTILYTPAILDLTVPETAAAAEAMIRASDLARADPPEWAAEQTDLWKLPYPAAVRSAWSAWEAAKANAGKLGRTRIPDNHRDTVHTVHTVHTPPAADDAHTCRANPLADGPTPGRGSGDSREGR